MGKATKKFWTICEKNVCKGGDLARICLLDVMEMPLFTELFTGCE